MGDEKTPRPAPANLTECVVTLKKNLSDGDLEKIRRVSLDEFRTSAHFELGMWIRNNFLFPEESALARCLKGRGVFHPDDMSSLILTALHKDLTKGDFDEDELFSLFAPCGG